MTVLAILLEPWAGHRRGSAVTLDRELALRLEGLGVLRISTPDRAEQEESTEGAKKPIKEKQRRTRGSR